MAVPGILNAAWERFVGAMVYLYRHSRPQFHPALHVLINSALLVPTLWLLDLAFRLMMDDTSQYDFEFLFSLTGVLATGELVRGHVRSITKSPPERWSVIAAAAGGAAAGLVFWAETGLAWGKFTVSELLGSVAFGTGMYLVLGWLFVQAAKSEAKQNGT